MWTKIEIVQRLHLAAVKCLAVVPSMIRKAESLDNENTVDASASGESDVINFGVTRLFGTGSPSIYRLMPYTRTWSATGAGPPPASRMGSGSFLGEALCIRNSSTRPGCWMFGASSPSTTI